MMIISCKMESCSHYDRGCLILSPCCAEWYPCRLCHDQTRYEEEKDVKKQHKMNRHEVKTVKCKSCTVEQAPNRECSECGFLLGHYFCSVCNMFDNNANKKIYHCEGCGICRIGIREAFFHCDACNACLAVDTRETHICRPDVLSRDCPICLEDLFTSRKPAEPLKCGHFLHNKCRKHMMKYGHFLCPVCNKLTIDSEEYSAELDSIIESTTMPDDLRDLKVNILCNECSE